MRTRSHWQITVVTMLIGGGLLGVTAGADDSGRFVDDDDSIFEAEIEAFAAAGLTQGCNPPVNDRYCPKEHVTRGQLASFLARLLELNDGGGGDLFYDDDTSVHRDNIDRIAIAGITFGCNPPDNDAFCPNAVVTRGQMAAFLVRALLLAQGGSVEFLDDDASIFEREIEALAAAGITLGCNPPANDRYCPASPITRGQMAAFIMRALRRDPLLVAASQPFADDPNRTVETELDGQPFQEINKLKCPKLVDEKGWVVEARTGGRPFMTVDSVSRNSDPWAVERCTGGESAISPAIIDAHYDAGKGVNRLWIGHGTGGGAFPIIMVATSDGFINLSGAQSPMLAGGALRLGFIGQPFDPALDYLAHIDELDVTVVDETVLRITYNVHSEIGEGTITVDVRWDETAGIPSLEVDARHAVRLRASVGFAGINFMRGPTLHGIVADGSTDGIEAFHDGRNAFVVSGAGFDRELLVPPLTPDVIERTGRSPLASGTSIVVDQPQGAVRYFSKTPGTRYEDRADLILEYVGTSGPPVGFERAQISVDLSDANPEANETVNLFFSSEAYPGPIFEYSYSATVAADDFADRYEARPRGIVYVSDETGGQRLYFLELDDQLRPVEDPLPLTDGAITDPHSPRAASDGRTVLFDADDYGAATELQRIYELDLTTAAVRRLTIDPFGASTDQSASLSADGDRFAFITDRAGTPERLVVEKTAVGLAGGYGNEVAVGHAADWCRNSDLIVFADTDGIHYVDAGLGIPTLVLLATETDHPAFSPDCEMVAYEDPSGVWTVAANGSGTTLAVDGGRSPAWVDAGHLLVELGAVGNRVVYVFDVATRVLTPVTSAAADSFEPTYVTAVE